MDLSNRQGRKEQGQRIQQAVEHAGLSIEELAQRIGCSRALIYQYLNGSTLAQPDRLQQIASHCGVPLTYFYSETVDSALSPSTFSANSSANITSVSSDVSSDVSDNLSDNLSDPFVVPSPANTSGQTPQGPDGSDSTSNTPISSSPSSPSPSSPSPSLSSPSLSSSSLSSSSLSSPSVSTSVAVPTGSTLSEQMPPQMVAARLREGVRILQELAVAQESPPDFRAMASTCERILSLAAQIGDREAMTRAQLDLGIALNKLGDFPRAAEALNRAVTLAIETHNKGTEMAARQSLGRALIMMGRTEQAHIQFQRIVSDGEFNIRWRALLALGSLHEQQGEYQMAMECFDEAATLLEEAEANRSADAKFIAGGMLYVNTNRRNVYLAGGDLRVARDLADRCLADAETLGLADQNLEARVDRGLCDLFLGQWGQAHDGLTTMLQLARFVGDQLRENVARAVLGLFFAAAGDFDAAVAYGKDALAQALSRGDRMTELHAQLALADAYSGPEGRLLEARYHTNQALSITTSVSYARSEVEGRIRLARIANRMGDVEGLRDASTRALRLAQTLGMRHLESLARVWYSEYIVANSVAYPYAIFADKRGSNSPIATPGHQERALEDVGNTLPLEQALEELEQALEELERAYELGVTTGFVETLWRAEDLRGRIARFQGNMSLAEKSFRNAIVILERLRESLTAVGIPDTLLENEDCLRVYIHLIELYRASGRAEDIAILLENTGWPPLKARTNMLGDTAL